MGYYLDFKFNSQKEQYDKEKLLDKFCGAGAERMDISSDGKTDDSKNMLLYKPIGKPVFFDVSEESVKKGFWAYLRFSGSESESTLPVILIETVQLAEKIGCRVYDGQINAFILKENLSEISERIEKHGKMVRNLLGTISVKEEHEEKIRKDKEIVKSVENELYTKIMLLIEDRLPDLLLKDMDLSVRAIAVCKMTEINNLKDLVRFFIEYKDFRKLRNVGMRVHQELMNCINDELYKIAK